MEREDKRQTRYVFTYRHTKYASYIGYITQAIINNLSPLLFVIFQKEFQISLEQIGFLISFNFGVQILVDFLAARYVDRIGYRNGMVLAHGLSALGLVGLGAFPGMLGMGYGGLLLATAMNAVGGGLLEVLVSPVVEALPGDEKDSAMSLLHSFYCWGHVAVVVLSTLYFNLAGSKNWQFLPMVWALVPFFNMFLFWKVPIRTLQEDGETMKIGELLKLRLFWLLFLMMVCSGAAEQAMSQWASLFAELGLQVSKNMGDLLGPCAFAVCMGSARTIYGIWGAKMKLKKVIGFCSVLCIFSYLLAVFAPIPLLALFGCAMCGFSVGIMWPGVFSLSSAACPQGGTAMFTILALAGDIGCGGGPGLVGIVSEWMDKRKPEGWSRLLADTDWTQLSLKAGILAGIIFPLGLLICVVILSRRRKK